MAETDQAPPLPGMAQCEITGKWMAEDDLVTIQGHRVCAEGKELLLERLKSGEVLPGEVERPSVLRRFGALFLDGLILGVINAVLVFLFIGSMFITQPAPSNPAAYATGLVARTAIAMIIVNLLSFAYLTLMHGLGGQTLGKMAAKIRVVKEDGSPIDIKIAALRALYYNGYAIIPQILTLVGLAFVGQIIGIIGGLYIFASAIVAMVDSAQQRAIHDRLAGTRVIVVA